MFYALNSSVFKKKKKIGDHFHSKVEIMILLYKRRGKLCIKTKQLSYVFNFHVNFTGSEYIGPIYKNF